MRWAALLLTILSLPLLFDSKPLEILRLKTFDAFVTTPEPSGYFTVLNITDKDIQKELLVWAGQCYFQNLIDSVGILRLV